MNLRELSSTKLPMQKEILALVNQDRRLRPVKAHLPGARFQATAFGGGN
jgi:hypothetical protein